MRLALVRQRYVAEEMEPSAENAIEALLERSVAVSLFTRQWPKTRLQLMEPVICNPPYAGRWWRDASFARAACHAIETREVDLVDADEPLACCNVYHATQGVHATRREQRRRAGARPFEELSAAAHEHYLVTMERRLLTSPWVSAVFCPSGIVRDDLHRRFGVAPARLHLVRPAVDTDTFHPNLGSLRKWQRERLGIPLDATVYLAVVRSFTDDGVHTLIEALARLPSSAHLVVVGMRRGAERHVHQAQGLGVRERVSFVGRQAELKPYYGAADVFVLPTFYDPLASAALAAMACGLPVVVSENCGASDLVISHDAGRVCDPLDANAFRAHMAEVQDRAVAERLGANARAAVLPLKDAALTLQRVLVYRELLLVNAEGARSVGTTTAAAADQAPSAVATGLPPEVPGSAAVSGAAEELPVDSDGHVPVLDQPVARDHFPPEIVPGTLDAPRAHDRTL